MVMKVRRTLMPKKLFFDLHEEKRTRITQAALSEFAEKTYRESSTNCIVKKAGISKGSLFKYFDTKEDLYFYILDHVLENFLQELKKEVTKLSQNLLERVAKYAELEFSWYLKNPTQYKFIKRAFFDSDSEIFQKIEKRYKLDSGRFYHSIFQDINFDRFKWDKQKIFDVLQWLLKGFNEEFIKKTILSDNNLKNVKENYLRELREYLTIIKEGLCKEGKRNV